MHIDGRVQEKNTKVLEFRRYSLMLNLALELRLVAIESQQMASSVNSLRLTSGFVWD